MRSALLHCKAAVLVTCVVGYFFSKPGGRRKSLALFSGFKFKFSDDQLGERSVIHIEFKMIAVPIGIVSYRVAIYRHHRASGLIDHKTRTPCRCPCGSKNLCEYTLCLCPLYKINSLEILAETSRNAQSLPS